MSEINFGPDYEYECGCGLVEDASRSDEEVVAFHPECPIHKSFIKLEVVADMRRSLDDAGIPWQSTSRQLN